MYLIIDLFLHVFSSTKQNNKSAKSDLRND